MRKGFTFDAALCVSCNACSAACILENGLQPGTRTLFAWNDHALPLVSVINLSMACNHCAEPACASGCPAVAYTIRPDGVVIHHPERCMGCGYCTWRCPYGAPKINPALGYIEKCHLCADRMNEELEPACVTACPTGAIKMTEKELFESTLPVWFPDIGIKPSLILEEAENQNRPVIIPVSDAPDMNNSFAGVKPDSDYYVPSDKQERDNRVPEGKPGGKSRASENSPDRENLLSDHDVPSPGKPVDRLRNDWSLAVFSILVISASVLLSLSALTGTDSGGIVSFALLAGAMAVSVAHLGRPLRAWRSLLNLFSSPLSREVAMVLVLTVISAFSWLRPGFIPPLITALAALLTVISLDMVYFAADRSLNLRLHSGQAFFTAIYAVSWFTEPHLIFIIFSMLAAVSVVMRFTSGEKSEPERILYYTRAMTLPIVFMLLYPGSKATDMLAMAFFIAGLAADRLLFYYDFTPPDISNSIKENFNAEYEKERDKQCQDAGIS